MQAFNWTPISKGYPDLKAGSSQDSEEVLVSLSDGSVTIDTYSVAYSMWHRFNKEVTHWSHKPNPANPENE